MTTLTYCKHLNVAKEVEGRLRGFRLFLIDRAD